VKALSAIRRGLLLGGWALAFGGAGCTADPTEECLDGPCAVAATTTSTSDGGGAGGQGSTCSANAPAGELPCDVEAVLAAKCTTCHAPDELAHSGAPFSLKTYADTQAPFGGRPRWRRMMEVIEPDAMPHMPYGNAPPLTADENESLDVWFAACAPPRPTGATCP
jgi:uncharacterized membrane protein